MPVSFNGVADTTLGFSLVAAPGTMHGASFGHATVAQPGRDGVRFVSTARVASAREIGLVGEVAGTTLADLRSKIDTLLSVVAVDDVLIQMDDFPSREFVGRLTEVQTQTLGPQQVALKAQVALKFLVASGTMRERTDTVVSTTTAYAALPLGTGRVRPVLTITGAATNPTITIRNQATATIYTLGFTLSLGAGVPLVIDCDKGTVIENGTTNRISTLTSGSPLVLLDPDVHAVYRTSSWPTIRVSSGTVEARYRRTWR